MSCRECAHLHIVNGRIVYARCLLGKAIFERYGAGRLLPSEHSCDAWERSYKSGGSKLPYKIADVCKSERREHERG